MGSYCTYALHSPNDDISKPDDHEAYYNRGTAYAQLGEYDTAIADYTTAIELNPDDVNALYNRATAYEALGENILAQKDFARTEALDPKIKMIRQLSEKNKESLQKDVAQAQEVVKTEIRKSEDFHESITKLKTEFRTDEKVWLRGSVSFVISIVGVATLNAINQWVPISKDYIYPIMAFFATLTFIIIRQYTNAKQLRIRESERFALAQMYQRTLEDSPEIAEKIADQIITTNAKGVDTSLPETLKNLGDAIKKNKISV